MATRNLLPPEIFIEIGQLLPTADLLSFALICRAAFRSIQDRLQHNKQLHSEFRVVHDRRPTTIPRLLRLTYTDRDAAWHIRVLEIWGLRPGFHKWKSWKRWHIPGPIPDWPEPYEDHSHLTDDFFAHDERSRYAEQMRSILRLSEEDTEGWMTGLLSGWDEPLKVMLVASLPELHRLNFIAYDSWNTQAFHSRPPLDMLVDVINSVQASLPGHGQWPVGLQSLRVINICSSTKWRHPHDAYYAKPSAVACLFSLPNLQTLNMSLVLSNRLLRPDYKLDAQSSNIQELALLNCNIQPEDLNRFLRAPRHLRKYMSRGAYVENEEEAWKILVERHGQDLEFISASVIPAVAYDNLARDLPNLKTIVNVNILSDVLSHDFRQILPETLEKLYLCVKSEQSADPYLEVNLIQSVLLNVIGLVGSKRHTKLHSICLRELSKVSAYEEVGGEANTISLLEQQWYIDMIKQIESSGVKTHLDAMTGSEEILTESEHIAIHNSIWPTFENLTEPRPLTKEEIDSVQPVQQEQQRGTVERFNEPYRTVELDTYRSS